MSLLIFSGCSRSQIATKDTMPDKSYSRKVTLFALENYTDTPQAGMRAANIVEGVLRARGYEVESKINISLRKSTLRKKIADAKKEESDYLFIGGVSEWRYKTGIDGEPAVSLQFQLINVSTQKIVWSATGSDSSWGNASIGTTAQELIESMLQVNAVSEKMTAENT